MRGDRITPSQLFSLILLFELGTALLVGHGLTAKQGAWIANLLGLAFGLVVLSIYIFLYHRFPGDTLTTFSRKIAGNMVGTLIGWIYVGYFLYIASRNLHDFSELFISSLFPNTRWVALEIPMILVVAYALFHGIVALSRIGQLFAFVYVFSILFFLVIVWVLNGEVVNVLPLTEVGWKPILNTAFPQLITFPFGEMVAFMMIFPFVHGLQQETRTIWLGIILSGIILSLSSIVIYGVLAESSLPEPFPFLEVIKMLGDLFIITLDPILIILLFVGGFFKISVFFYASMLGATQLLNISQKITLPLFAVFLLILSNMIAKNFSEHIEEGLKIVPLYVHLPIQIGIPFLPLLICLVRRIRPEYKVSPYFFV